MFCLPGVVCLVLYAINSVVISFRFKEFEFVYTVIWIVVVMRMVLFGLYCVVSVG